MKKFLSLVITLIIFFMPVCAKSMQGENLLELREMQTKYYDTTDTLKVIKAVVNTLQDNGFVIHDGEMELCYLRAKKEFKAKRTDKGRVALYCAEFAYYGVLTGLTFGLEAPFLIIPSMHMKNEISLHPVIIDANINIETVGKRTKVRFTLIEKVLENADGYTAVKSSPRKVVRHYESEIFQEFFAQVDKNLFLEKTL